MKLITPSENPVSVLPLHFGATAQEVAGQIAGAKNCTVGLAVLQPGGGSEIDRHPQSEQVFYVLKGAFTLANAEQGDLTALPGQALYVAPNEPHAAANRGTEEAIALVVTAPPVVAPPVVAPPVA